MRAAITTDGVIEILNSMARDRKKGSGAEQAEAYALRKAVRIVTAWAALLDPDRLRDI